MSVSQLLDSGQRQLEITKFNYYTSKPDEAAATGAKTIAILNKLLAANQQEVPAAYLKRICNEAISLYTKIKKKQFEAKIDTKICWIASKINNEMYYPTDGEVFVDKTSECFDDKMDLLTKKQLENFDKWDSLEGGSDWSCNPRGISDLYQEDFLSTCSLVSAMISVTSKNSSVIFNKITPKEPSGKYCVLLFINGCERLVFINDSLPGSSKPSVTLFLRSFSNKQLLWPALVEKAYFKILGRNSYQFEGSNAGIDTYMLTGWIPEFVKPHEYLSREKDSQEFWEMIFQSYKANKCVLCAGTGSSFPKSSKLVANHDYAIVDLQEDSEGNKKVLIKNPWLLTDREAWYSFSYVLMYFDTIYINWAVSSFPTAKHIRFLYSLNTGKDPEEILGVGNRSQFSVRNISDHTVDAWLLLSENVFDISNRDHSTSLKFTIVKSDVGEKIYALKGRKRVSQTIETSNSLCLAKLELMPKDSVTIIVEATPLDKSTVKKVIPFNLFCYSSIVDPSQLMFDKAARRYQNNEKVDDSWNMDNSGGNWLQHDYVCNPQYELVCEDYESDSLADFIFTLLVDNHDILFNLQIFWYPDTDVLQKFDEKKLIYNEKYTAEGELSTGTLQLQSKKRYLLLLSTFDPIANYKLDKLQYLLLIASNAKFQINKLNTTSLGLFTDSTVFNWNNSNRMQVQFQVARETTVSIRIVNRVDIVQDEYSSYRPKIRANVYTKNYEWVYYNKQFDDCLYGLFINKIKINEGTYTIFIERFEQGTGEVEVSIGGNTKVFMKK